MSMRILVTHKGETGYLHTEVGADLRTHYALTLDERNADAYSDRRRAEKMATRVRGRFESVALEDAAAPEN
ncbi:hypothetical protein [Microbacterium thalli]|uniref:hypothetical protein n=1 Tax=Microbacterium thalli TaxID=3027921 RepID=UPI002365CF03|nr:hypothetical protein [Microbacterium thalli]MDD7930767.1 hypothetical protein [Microbacterium thalli]